MLVGIIGDIHLGINENKVQFIEYQNKCLEFIFEEFRLLGIKDVIYLGDIFDKRQSISVKSLKQCYDIFDNEFNQYFLLGNHDVVFKNSNDLNSVEILLGDNNKVYTNLPETLELGGKTFLMTPWINKSNTEISNTIIKESKADYLMGHLDLSGFEMMRGIVSTQGHCSLKTLENFEHVVSGHYHCYSNRGNITYIGNVCQMTWNDYDEKKHFGYINTETDQLNLVEIPHILYEKIRIKSAKDCKNPLQYKDKIVKCYLYTNRNIKIEKFISEIVDVAMTVNVVDEQIMLGTTDFNIEDQNMSVLELWHSYVSELDLTEREMAIVNKIFEDVYIKVQIGDMD